MDELPEKSTDNQKTDYQKFLEKREAGEFIPDSELETYLKLIEEVK